MFTGIIEGVIMRISQNQHAQFGSKIAKIAQNCKNINSQRSLPRQPRNLIPANINPIKVCTIAISSADSTADWLQVPYCLILLHLLPVSCWVLDVMSEDNDLSIINICVITSDFKYRWFGTLQRKIMKKNVLLRSGTFWIASESSFEIRVFVCKQSEFRLFLIAVLWLQLRSRTSQLFQLLFTNLPRTI